MSVWESEKKNQSTMRVTGYKKLRGCALGVENVYEGES